MKMSWRDRIKPGDLVRVIDSNFSYDGMIGIVIDHTVVLLEFKHSDPIFEATSVLLEGVFYDWIASE
jgi:hypothetical protein